MISRRRAGVLVAAGGVIAVVAGLAGRDRVGTGGEVLDARGVQQLYDAIAPLYDVPAALYHRGVGRRLGHVAIAELRLRPGDTVVDLGTGTGWKLPRLAEAVGPPAE